MLWLFYTGMMDSTLVGYIPDYKVRDELPWSNIYALTSTYTTATPLSSALPIWHKVTSYPLLSGALSLQLLYSHGSSALLSLRLRHLDHFSLFTVIGLWALLLSTLSGQWSIQPMIIISLNTSQSAFIRLQLEVSARQSSQHRA